MNSIWEAICTGIGSRILSGSYRTKHSINVCNNHFRKKQKKLEASLSKSHHQLSFTHDELQCDYGELMKSYDEPKRQYENLRRPFSVTKDVPYTDVWNFSPVLYYPGKHLCEKPAALLEHIINASSKSGHTVADFFMGSGSRVKAAIQLGRQAIGVELETDRFLQTKKEIENLIRCALYPHPEGIGIYTS